MTTRTIRTFVAVGFGLMSGVGATAAHHSWQAEYDEKNVIVLKGVVTKVQWTNPHVRIYIDVKDEKGAITNWDLELQSVNTLTRAGWDRTTIKAGLEVTVSAWAARDGSKRGNARESITLADGRKIFAGERARGADEEIRR